MSFNLKESIIGIGYGILTMLFMIGLVPWNLVSKILGCVVAMFAIKHIRKNMSENKSCAYFTVSYIVVLIVVSFLISSISAGA